MDSFVTCLLRFFYDQRVFHIVIAILKQYNRPFEIRRKQSIGVGNKNWEEIARRARQERPGSGETKTRHNGNESERQY